MTDITPRELAEIERRFENFDVTTAEVYDVGIDEFPPNVALTRATAERMLRHELNPRTRGATAGDVPGPEC